jgi:FtsP/CotA-like multicopper oxidase with cupredoxin domain
MKALTHVTTRLLVVTSLLFSLVVPPGVAVAASQQTASSDRIEKWTAAREQSYISQEDREAAALRMKILKASTAAVGGVSASASVLTTPTPGGVPDYFGAWANWAYSPPLRKFVDTLPGVGAANANNLGNFIGQAYPDTTTYPGSDYYEIELREFEQQLHSDMPPTRLRGYVQVNKGTDPNTGLNTINPDPITYLGPFITATKDKPVRIKFTNKLPVGEGGNLFIPVDTTVMGAGMGPTPDPMDPAMMATYTQNRATLHLHGGITPWISDGTPHQWITPANEMTPYPEGVSVHNVPDMPDPGDGSMTFFYTNQQSARLMWVHDHSYGITRLNVYVGEVMPYAITDDVEKQLIADGIIPGAADTIPLVVQDKTFVDENTIAQTDPTWNWGSTAPVPHTGDLWVPHVYVPAQNPADPGGMNPTGRWHYGPWFWPPTSNIKYPPIPNPYYDPAGTTPWENPTMPATPNPSMGMEAFNDTPLVNGTAYPTVEIDPKTYRLRILNGANDRFFNLQWYLADPTTVAADGRTNTEVKMVPAVPTPGFPDTWPIDGREGGAPDPATAGPEWLQIGNESGFLPMPAVVPNQPITWNADQTTFNFGNVQDHSLLIAPAERADVIVDFSQYAGKTIILYNDAPAAFPALDPRLDYYTGAPDMTDTGGTTTPQVGYGPNTRTVMQVRVKAAAPAPAYNSAALTAAFTTTATHDGVFKQSQHPVIVPDSRYDAVYNDTFVKDPYVRIYENLQKTFKLLDGSSVTLPLEPKAIQDEMGETFDPEYGRMSGKFGLQIPGVGGAQQNLLLYGYWDPPTENLTAQMTPLSPVLPGGTQMWKITHNGVDTHPVHFHLYDVQLINRVGWDNAVRAPDDNELGWKETVRVSPLEDTIVAIKPVIPKLPFGVPDSVRPLDPTAPLGTSDQFNQVGPGGVPRSVLNVDFNFGWEYVFHCHILSHEEMDMMRPVTVDVPHGLPGTPDPLVATGTPGGPVELTWTDQNKPPAVMTIMSSFETTAEVGFRVERAPLPDGGPVGTYEPIANAPANTESFTDMTTVPGSGYSYRVVAYNAAGDAPATNTQDITPAAYVDSYVVTPMAGPGGMVMPMEPQAVPVGSPADVTFTFTPEPGYHVADVTVDGVSVGAPSSYTVPAVAADHMVDVMFMPDMHTITPSVTGDTTLGKIWWDTPQMVQDHAMKTFAFVPEPGYRVAQVLVDGNPVDLPVYGGKPWNFYTFSDVTQDHTISVSFEQITYTITPSASAGGTISPSTPQSVVIGADSPTFTMTPNPGYHLSELRIDGALVATTSTYTFTNVQGDHTIAATFTSDRMLPVYRFYNLVNGSHFYTASASERDMVAATWPNVWSYEGTAYSVNLDNPANKDPLYRFYNKVRTTHFYTASAQEADMVKATWPDVFTYEGVAYNVSAGPAANTVPVYRFYNVKSGSHFYTISGQERDHVMATWPDIFSYEGVAFYVGY